MLFFPFPERTRTVDSAVWCQCLQQLPQAPRESLEPAGDEAARGQPGEQRRRPGRVLQARGSLEPAAVAPAARVQVRARLGISFER